ncbi:bifunctional enoyl-CoA hydratase/phosphate acetyltransferase [Actibacterium sp. MT2.3-13A]|uniref:bifunctional enoyl-CoA hydratase/phosphate acetyltransferase n=1 Tax=Actibacterium sp. MT2.3-13A TaxID=2828332 RepID=UPI001BA5361A|nr:bifunctional enoyl-CoA hydratase/phosphate acetyltransferase [Actibacterium sp. MT2.3-13A]
MPFHTNTLWSELEIGMEAEIRHVCSGDDFYVFANASGNMNPLHLPREDGDANGTPEAVAPAMWLGALISAVLGNFLPGPGTLYKSQALAFLERVHAGDEIVARVRLTDKGEGNTATFDTWVEDAAGKRVAVGEAVVIAPERRVRIDLRDVPGLTVNTHQHFDALLLRAAPLEPMPTAVIAPEDAASLGGAMLAYRQRLLAPILIGDRGRIAAAAQEIDADLTGIEVIDIPNHSQAAARAVQLVHEGRAKALMKGSLHTDDLLHHVVKRDGGLRTHRRLSHVFVMDVPGLDHLLMVTDAAINIAPTLEQKVDIVQNAINLAHALDIPEPKVGILSAVETVNPKIPSTIDAAVLSKMAERGQIQGGLVDGPLAMDNAIDLKAAKTKGISSAVAGQAQILVVPNLESGNMLAKELTFLAHAQAAGIVVGAQCPIILTSRADDERSRLASCAVAVMAAEWARGR